MMEFDTKTILGARAATTTFDQGLRDYMLKVYNLMSVALALTAVSAFLVLAFPPLTSLMFKISPNGVLLGYTGFGMLMAFAPVGIALYFFMGSARLDVQKSQTLFWIYAVLTGMSLSSLGLVYTGASLAKTFFVCSGSFAGMSIYGYSTKRDLTSFGSFMVMGLIGLLLTSVVNIFFQSPAIYFVTSIIGVVVFMGLIAWNTQNIKNTYYSVGGGEMGQRMAIVSAFGLYLDFINLFLYLVRFLGVARRD